MVGLIHRLMGYAALACTLAQPAFGNVKEQAAFELFHQRPLDERVVEREPASQFSMAEVESILQRARYALLNRGLPLADPQKWDNIAYGYVRLDELRDRNRYQVKNINVIEGPLTLTDEPIEPKTIELYVVSPRDVPAVRAQIDEQRSREALVTTYCTQAAFLYLPHTNEKRTVAEAERELYAILREDAKRKAEELGADTITIDPKDMRFDIQTFSVTGKNDEQTLIRIKAFLMSTTWKIYTPKDSAAKGKP